MTIHVLGKWKIMFNAFETEICGGEFTKDELWIILNYIKDIEKVIEGKLNENI